MKITVYSFTTDDDGTRCEVFATEQEANEAAWNWCYERCDPDDLMEGMDLDEDADIKAEVRAFYPHWTDLYDVKGGYLDTCNTDEHELEVAA